MSPPSTGFDTTASPVGASARIVNSAREFAAYSKLPSPFPLTTSTSLTSVADASAGTMKLGFAASAADSVTVLSGLSLPSSCPHS